VRLKEISLSAFVLTPTFELTKYPRLSSKAGVPHFPESLLCDFVVITHKFSLGSERPGESSQRDWNRIEGNWKQFKGQAKEKWGRLTDDDLDVINGRQDQLEGKIQDVNTPARLAFHVRQLKWHDG
jgi:uncharacterized protein YjbJ (UPF0337 family)